jgi:hypothetical protein
MNLVSEYYLTRPQEMLTAESAGHLSMRPRRQRIQGIRNSDEGF